MIMNGSTKWHEWLCGLIDFLNLVVHILVYQNLERRSWIVLFNRVSWYGCRNLIFIILKMYLRNIWGRNKLPISLTIGLEPWIWISLIHKFLANLKYVRTFWPYASLFFNLWRPIYNKWLLESIFFSNKAWFEISHALTLLLQSHRINTFI